MKLRVPPRFKDATIDQLHSSFSAVHDWWKDSSMQGKGLFLSGPPGVGKTHALVALTRVYVEKTHKDHEFVTAPELFDRYCVFGEGSAEIGRDEWREQSFNRTYETVPWLVLNDLGKEYRAGKLGEQVTYKLGRLLRARSEKRLLTHISTNLTISSGAASFREYGESILSLAQEMFHLYEVNGPDLRGR